MHYTQLHTSLLLDRTPTRVAKTHHRHYMHHARQRAPQQRPKRCCTPPRQDAIPTQLQRRQNYIDHRSRGQRILQHAERAGDPLPAWANAHREQATTRVAAAAVAEHLRRVAVLEEPGWPDGRRTHADQEGEEGPVDGEQRDLGDAGADG